MQHVGCQISGQNDLISGETSQISFNRHPIALMVHRLCRYSAKNTGLRSKPETREVHTIHTGHRPLSVDPSAFTEVRVWASSASLSESEKRVQAFSPNSVIECGPSTHHQGSVDSDHFHCVSCGLLRRFPCYPLNTPTMLPTLYTHLA